MITSFETWKELAVHYVGEDAIPDHEDLGVRYPWKGYCLHAMSRDMTKKIRMAERVLRRAAVEGGEWRMGLSAGKDSTAMAALFQSSGIELDCRGMSVKDDMDYPGEYQYIEILSWKTGMQTDILSPPVSLEGFLRENRISLVEDVHSRAAEFSAKWFYALIDEYQKEQGYSGALLGLRAGESRGRKMNRIVKGTLYERKDTGFKIAAPLSDWTAADVHAYLLLMGVPILPVYLCIDPGMEPDTIRKSWWIAGGGVARHGHYACLRRWWPILWDKACEIDPEVRLIS
jgi:3'-phosphoadenosine 5'-phosphosulfate sulfotransferase (PAPS reductase)/FAD synthetase